MEREMFGYLFKYENDMLFKKRKGGKKWTCCNDLKIHITGYIRIRVDDKVIGIHRLVYFFHNPSWNIHDICFDNSIDHINGDKLDNKIENLRIVNSTENNQNRTHYGGKPIKGVHYHEKNNYKWRASWRENKKSKSKCFKTETEALEHRAKMVEIHYSHHPSKRNDLIEIE
tara:strand:- start:527 stop:1039 length:513 start_codon:yes stop_codon:yes gene_type:complete